MSTPLLRGLKKKFPHARIEYMVGDWSREAIEGNPFLDEIIPYLNLRKGSPMEILRRILELRRRKYDIVFFLEVGRAPVLVSRLIGAPIRISFDFEGKGKFLLSHSFSRKVSDMHEMEAFLQLGKFIGVEVDSKNMDFPLSGSDREFAQDFLAAKGISEGRLLVGMFPGGGNNPGTTMPSKRWGEENFNRLARSLIDQHNSIVIVFGGILDRELVERLGTAIGESALLAVDLSLKELGALIERCQVFITNDCGPMHVAAAVGTPTVSIWGPTDPKLLAPFGEKHTVIQTKMDCAPCYKQILGTFEPCEDPACMKAIIFEGVLEAVEKVIMP